MFVLLHGCSREQPSGKSGPPAGWGNAVHVQWIGQSEHAGWECEIGSPVAFDNGDTLRAAVFVTIPDGEQASLKLIDIRTHATIATSQPIQGTGRVEQLEWAGPLASEADVFYVQALLCNVNEEPQATCQAAQDE